VPFINLSPDRRAKRDIDLERMRAKFSRRVLPRIKRRIAPEHRAATRQKTRTWKARDLAIAVRIAKRAGRARAKRKSHFHRGAGSCSFLF
jgi:hypothetical protein